MFALSLCVAAVAQSAKGNHLLKGVIWLYGMSTTYKEKIDGEKEKDSDTDSEIALMLTLSPSYFVNHHWVITLSAGSLSFVYMFDAEPYAGGANFGMVSLGVGFRF